EPLIDGEVIGMETKGPLFHRFAKWTANVTGKAGTFALCIAIIFVWAFTGPLFGYSDSWQLIINTGTTIITFLMVFLIQNTQNRDTQELHLKLDELIRATKGARNMLLDLEELDDKQLDQLRAVYERLGRKARRKDEE
ncbi:MAG TPA: low affinity iron permease family protein, partial [Candidatus Saccharimonadales bacterium]|nr:low affinity iron permease family protein [Candidatus Saccharimonadales bacterium]